MGESYRGHRLDAIPAAFHGWVPTIDGSVYGTTLFLTRARAIEDAQREVGAMGVEEALSRPIPLRAVPALRLVQGGIGDEAAILGEYKPMEDSR